MEEDVFVIRLKPNSEVKGSRTWLPSEQRYSASFVLGLGSVHVTLGAVSALFAILALFLETEANQVWSLTHTSKIPNVVFDFDVCVDCIQFLTHASKNQH